MTWAWTHQFNSILYLIPHRAIQLFTVFQDIHIINMLYRLSYCFQLHYSQFSFSIICMFCGNREGISILLSQALAMVVKLNNCSSMYKDKCTYSMEAQENSTLNRSSFQSRPPGALSTDYILIVYRCDLPMSLP